MELPPCEPIIEYLGEKSPVSMGSRIRGLEARLRLAMEYAGHSEKCATNYRAFQQKVSSPCDCGLTALRERLVAEGLL